MNIRKPKLTASETTIVGRIVKQLKRSGSGIRDSLILSKLLEHSVLHKKYKAHCETFDISSQERASIFSGEIGLCKNPECRKYTSWKRPSYRRFCSSKCAGPNTVEGRKATCLAKYGVACVSQVPEITIKRSESLRAAYAAKGRVAPRKGKFEYQVPAIRPNTGSKFYVYALLDTRKPGPFKYGRWKFDYEPFYVGKGKGARAFDHLRTFDLVKISNPHKKNKIRKIIEAGLTPEVVLKRIDLDESKAFEFEAKLIHAIGCGKLGPLTNSSKVTSVGISGYTHTRKTRRMLSQQSKEVWANYSKNERAVRNSSISTARGCPTVVEYKRQLKGLFSGRISVIVSNSVEFRLTHRFIHVCKCGYERNVSPHYILYHKNKIGCPKCIKADPTISEQRRARSIESKAKRTLPQYLKYLKVTYRSRVSVEHDPKTFTMCAKAKHMCVCGYKWVVSPKLFKRYAKGCPRCRQLNVGHI